MFRISSTTSILRGSSPLRISHSALSSKVTFNSISKLQLDAGQVAFFSCYGKIITNVFHSQQHFLLKTPPVAIATHRHFASKSNHEPPPPIDPLSHLKRRRLIKFLSYLLVVSSLSGAIIYYTLFYRSEAEPVPRILKYAAENHLEKLRAMGVSVEQQKQDYEQAMVHSAEHDRIEFEEFLKEIEKNEGSRGFIARIWENFRMTIRFAYLLFKLVPLYVSSYYLEKNRWNERVFETFRTLGVCFIKIGQWLGTRPDLIDADLCAVLQRFHGQGYIHSMRSTKRTIEESFGKTMEEMFDEFDETPIGSGSIAQVYKARLRGEDHYVAVKVRHPNVGTILSRDLRILRTVCSIVSHLPQYRWMNLDHNIVNFARNMNAQVDLRFEAENLRQFIENFKDIENVKFPAPYQWNSEVLIEEYMDMKCIKEYIDHPDQNLRTTLAELGVFIFLDMLRQNFVHGDLHVGNIFVSFLPLKDHPEEMQPCYVLLDAGLVNKLTPQNRLVFLQLFAAFVVDDAETVTACLLDENFRNVYLHFRDKLDQKKVMQMEDFTDCVRRLLHKVNHAETEGKRKVAPAAHELLKKAQEYQIPLQSNFTNLIISSVIVEGVGRLLDPELPFLSQCEDLLKHNSLTEAKSFLKDRILGFRVFKNVRV
mmetsp:Transcript_2929/g.11167  ORF Transcript_2929/g.11167 Transcript_2929/m.11167 type:complete len:649 (-) Transcript_2929:2010-3956(-)